MKRSNEMKLEDISVSIECEIITDNDKTEFYFDKVSYEVPFSFPTKSKKGLLFDKISTYVRTDRRENGKVVTTDVLFQLYYIELYQNDFKKAIEDFKNIIFLQCSEELKVDVLVKAFKKIIDISTTSYDKACAYITESTSMTYNTLEGTFNRRFKGSFREYCGLDSRSK